MFEYTYQNHFRFGYLNEGFFRNRPSKDALFIAQYGRCEKLSTSWREANKLACLDIQKKAHGPIWVLFSGGVDSEICIRSFLEAQVPVKIATLRFHGGLNDHDLEYVYKLKSLLNLDIEFFDLNLEQFWKSPAFYEITNPIQCVSPILACHLWLADQLDGTPVIAQGEPHLKKDVPNDYVPGVSPYLPSSWRLVESERLCSLYRHFILQNRPAVPGFFQYMPEQFYSYLRFNPLLQDLVQNKVVGKLGTRTSKNLMAYQFYPEVAPREKFTGFEKIQALHDVKRRELAQKFPDSDANTYIEYHDLILQLSSERLS